MDQRLKLSLFEVISEKRTMSTRETKFNPNSPHTHHLESPQLGYLQIAKEIKLEPLPQNSSQQQIQNRFNHSNNNFVPKKRHNDSVTSTKSMPVYTINHAANNNNSFSPPIVHYDHQQRKNMSMPHQMNTNQFIQRTMSMPQQQRTNMQQPYGYEYVQNNMSQSEVISDEWTNGKRGGSIVRPTKDTYKEPLLDDDIDYGLETVTATKRGKSTCCCVVM